MARKKKPPREPGWFTGTRPDLTPVAGLVVYAPAYLTVDQWDKLNRPCWSILFTAEPEGHFAATHTPACCDLGAVVEPPDDDWRAVMAGVLPEKVGSDLWQGAPALCHIIDDPRCAVGDRIEKYRTPQKPAWVLPADRVAEIARPFPFALNIEAYQLVGGLPHA